MFEGLVRKLLRGCLGHYVKDIQLDKLNYSLQEIVLNDVELNLEAFDYLRLPFSLKQGRVGKLIIKIPWKLGWGPIIITLEGVFICACRWDDNEWSKDAIERRELAAKMAKLATAELAKLSKLVCDSKVGNSFKSYMMAKILDSIQVSIKNVHFSYCEGQSKTAQTVLGLKFSSLSILKQTLVGSFCGNLKSNQVNKAVEILALEIYCGTLEGIDFKSWTSAHSEGNKSHSILEPVDISVSLLMNKSGFFEKDAPQYSISVESTNMVLSLDEFQLQQIFMLWDNIHISHIKEKFGRYRPWANPLSMKFKGWKVAWWHYAQESVLSDVRKKLKKTSSRYFKERLTNCRKYVNLYKAKLDFLRQEQPNNEYVFAELELMEKKLDIEDILSYRSTAEYEMRCLQECVLTSSASHLGIDGSDIVGAKMPSIDRSSNWSCGWLYWLPHGMLGAGGTEDSTKFSGVVSDDVVRDIREATDFDPVYTSYGEAAGGDNFFLSAIKFCFPQISATLRSMKFGRAIAELTFSGLTLESKIWQDVATIYTLVKFMDITYPCNGAVILHAKKLVKSITFEKEHPFISLQIDMSPLNQDMGLLLKVVVQPLEFTWDLEFFSNLVGFYCLLASFEFHQKRVLSSLNGIVDLEARLLSKAEYVSSFRKKVAWDVSFANTVVKIPWIGSCSEQYEMVLECRSLCVVSRFHDGSFASPIEDELHVLSRFLNSVFQSDFSSSFRLHGLYDQFEVKLNDLMMMVVMPQFPQAMIVLEKIGSHLTIASCIIQDEPILKQLQMFVVVPSIHACLSPVICGAILGFISHVEFWLSKYELMIASPTPIVFSFYVKANVESFFCCIELFNDEENMLGITLALQEVNGRYSESVSKECWITFKALKILTKPLNGTDESQILCSSDNFSSACEYDVVGGLDTPRDLHSERSSSVDECFLLHYESSKSVNFAKHKFFVSLNDVDFHCYPYIIGLLLSFSDRIPVCGLSYSKGNSICSMGDTKNMLQLTGIDFQRFGFSNFCDPEISESDGITLSNFPFVTIYNSGSLGCLETSLVHAVPDWRKYFRLTQSKTRSSEISLVKRSDFDLALPLNFTDKIQSFSTAEASDGTTLAFTDLNATGIRVHFHDSSCIVGTLTFPVFTSSLSIHEDCFDILCSCEGLVLSSSWWIEMQQGSLWGPLLPNISDVINVHMKKWKKKSGELSCSHFDLSVSIQHVLCILPPEFLAILIGYFSLPDWSYVADEKSAVLNVNILLYKFEILDSVLVVPVKKSDNQLLMLELQQLYCSFFPSSDVLNDIPVECRILENKVTNEEYCVNIFGRELILSLLLWPADGIDATIFYQISRCQKVSLIDPLCVDIWVRLPSEHFCPTCVMVRMQNCHLIVEDRYIFHGSEALLDVINQFSSVGKEAECFTYDVLHFRRSKKCLEEKDPVLDNAGMEIKCSVNFISIKFGHTSVEPMNSHGLIAQTDMQFTWSASLKNTVLLGLDVTFFSLVLYSSLHSKVLAQCISTCSTSAVLDIQISKSNNCGYDLCVVIPSLNIWMHLCDWIEVTDLINSYIRYHGETSLNEFSSASFVSGSINPDGIASAAVSQQSNLSPGLSLCISPENVFKDIIFHTKLENFGMTFYVPLLISEEFNMTEVHGKPKFVSSNIVKGKCVTVTLHGRSCEFFFSSSSVRIISDVEKTIGNVILYKDGSTQSWPFFHFIQNRIEIEIGDIMKQSVNVRANVHCGGLELWLSYQVFLFWNDIPFVSLETGNSESMFVGIHFESKFREVSILLSDGRWGFNERLIEIILRNLLFHVDITTNTLNGSIHSELTINYNNFQKVLWEPLLEPWRFQLQMIREYGKSPFLNIDAMTNIVLESKAELNLNFTETLIEAVFRVIEMIKDARGFRGLNNHPEKDKLFKHPNSQTDCTEKFAPYIIQNLTSLPLVFHIFKGLVNFVEFDASMCKNGELINPGSSFPLYIDETPEQQFFHFRPFHSSENPNENKSSLVVRHYISVMFNGTTLPSPPISMDLGGLAYFEVDFSNASNKTEAEKFDDVSKHKKTIEEIIHVDSASIVPVVVDVSVKHYSKLVRFYSTVVLLNSTSVPFELRFDIPFGVSPKMLDPIYPGQEFPLPLHLAEAGRIRWRPLSHNYLWSEAHNLSNILSRENKIGHLRYFVCYPSNLSCDPFRCCISVQYISLLPSCMPKKGSRPDTNDSEKLIVEGSDNKNICFGSLKNRCIHYLTLSAPLLVKNFLPEPVSLIVESGGIIRSALLSEVENSFFHVDASHDLAMKFKMNGFKPSASVVFPRSEIFTVVDKVVETKLFICETVTLVSDLCPGLLHVIVEKTVDVFSGAREVCIYVPFLLYNCTGFPIIISNSSNERSNECCDAFYAIPSSYSFGEKGPTCRKDGLCLFSSPENSCSTISHGHNSKNMRSLRHVVSSRKCLDPLMELFPSEPIFKFEPLKEYEAQDLSNCLNKTSSSNIRSKEELSKSIMKKSVMVKPYMYSPFPKTSVGEIVVRVSQDIQESVTGNLPIYFWSTYFALVPPTGLTTILVPQVLKNAAYIISVSSSSVGGQLLGRTEAIIFQPRFVLCNACTKNMLFKQKGTKFVFQLGIGMHTHLNWMDITRELLVSVCFNEPGWEWSGSFSPENLGDTQVKMRNYDSGAVRMIMVEVQNADISMHDGKVLGNSLGTSGTNLILLSDDDTGFLPYRIDNFSKERLRIYQHKCETFATIVHPYTSCPYAWDEPCYTHRLTVEVPGECVLGSYSLDDVGEFKSVNLSSTSEKTGRTLLISLCAEGAKKVLSVVDSSYHILGDIKKQSTPWYRRKGKNDQKQDPSVRYSDKISIVIPFIGISLINSTPKELIFACARNTTIDFLQTLEQQKFSFQISSLQIDSQLHNTPYPVILSFDHQFKSIPAVQLKHVTAEINSKSENIMHSDGYCEPAFCLAAARWRNKDVSCLSFEYISFRISEFHLELDQEMILSLFDFSRIVFSRSQCKDSEYFNSNGFPLCPVHAPAFTGDKKCDSLFPSVVPIGSPWQQIYHLGRREKKIYVEVFELAPIKCTLSFSSTPWLLRNGVRASGDSLLQRSLMALADVEGAKIHLKPLTLTHHMASLDSIEQIPIRHYSKQIIHEMYKVFGSAGVIGNPMGFARSLGLGIKDFLSVPAMSVLQSPIGLMSGVAQGTTSLLSNTVYAVSDTATQFSRAARKGIIALTLDDLEAAKRDTYQMRVPSGSRGVINEILQGLTGLLQSPIKGAEKHGLPGVFSGLAMGVTGLVARPAASILEVTGKTAQSIRNRSKAYQIRSQRFRVRLPRPLSRELPLRPYSWEEAVAACVLANSEDGFHFQEEVLVACKGLRDGGKYAVATELLILVVSCSCLAGVGREGFEGVGMEPKWVVETEIEMENVIHVDSEGGVVHIVGSKKQEHRQHCYDKRMRRKEWRELPFFQTNLEFGSHAEADEMLRVLVSSMERGKERGWGTPAPLHCVNLQRK